MKLNKMSQILSRIMLVIFSFGIILPVSMRVFNLQHKSYILSFAAGAAGFCAAALIYRHFAGKREFTGEKHTVRTGLLLALLCFAVNLIWILAVRIEPYEDYLCFYNAAVDIASDAEPIRNGRYLALFPHILGYSSFLGMFIRLFGEHPMLAPMLNLLLTTASGVITYALLLENADYKAAVAGFVLWILYPSKGLYNALVFSEPLYTCLILLFILVISGLNRKIAGYRYFRIFAAAVFSGLLLMCINATRPIAAVPIIAFFIWLLLLRGEKLKDRALWKKWICFALVMTAVYMAGGKLWKAHTEDLLGEETSSTPGYSIYVGFNRESNGTFYFPDMDKLAKASAREGNAPDAQKYLLELAKERISSGDINFPEFFARKLCIFLGNDEGGAFSTHFAMSDRLYKLLLIISNTMYYFLICMCCAGIVKIWKNNHLSPALLAPIYVIGLSLAHMLVEVQDRYHYSIIPMLIIAAAFSAGATGKNKKETEL